MSDQDGRQVPAMPRPSPEDAEAWKAYWQAHGQPWRTEPEIDTKRQEELTQRRTIVPDIEKGIYPFKGMKLSRADVEWLLATHEKGRGPVDWSDESQWGRQGLSLCGADLSQQDLGYLPLACLEGGPMRYKQPPSLEEQINTVAVNMQGANLIGAHLQGAYLHDAQLQDADLSGAKLQGAHLSGAKLQSAFLGWAELQDADLNMTKLQDARLHDSQLQSANFFRAELQGAVLSKAQLQGANLHEVQLQGADLSEAQLQGADLSEAQLDSVHLNNATLSDEEYGAVYLADIKWGEINLAVVNWVPVKRLGDEHLAHKRKTVNNYRAAVRANRQLAVVLQGQGLNEEADRFAYRAQRLQRIILRKQRKYGQYLFSGFLDLLAGYGYRPGRSVLWYLATILIFALGYHIFGQLSLWPPDAFVYSLTSFHGRGFFPGLEGKPSLHDPLIMFAAFEAVVGLFIEISFIATFTQRFFGK